MAVDIKSPREIEAMRVVGRMAGETLCLIGEKLRPGMTTEEIDVIVREDTARRKARAAPLGYVSSPGPRYPYPKSVCTSINDVVCHGIPGPRVLRNGDIVNVDITTLFNGYHGDTSATFFIGTPSEEARRVTETARKALALGIAEVREGARLGDIGAAIQEYVEAQGFSVVRDFVGHGIGRIFHEALQVKHYGRRGTGIRLRRGMTFTIEPMVNVGRSDVVVDPEDRWTVTTADGKLSAQFEHTILVTETGAEILTQRPRVLQNSEG